MAVNIYWAGPTPKKYSGRAHPLETLLNVRARALRALGDLLISFYFFIGPGAGAPGTGIG